jgi:hypothetical protein
MFFGVLVTFDVLLFDVVHFSCQSVVVDAVVFWLFQDFFTRVHAFCYTNDLMIFHAFLAATRCPYEM